MRSVRFLVLDCISALRIRWLQFEFLIVALQSQGQLIQCAMPDTHRWLHIAGQFVPLGQLLRKGWPRSGALSWSCFETAEATSNFITLSAAIICPLWRFPVDYQYSFPRTTKLCICWLPLVSSTSLKLFAYDTIFYMDNDNSVYICLYSVYVLGM